MALAGKKITLLVSASIAAYKSAELIRELTRRGAIVQVAMTQGATEFIGALTLQTLSKHPVMCSLLDCAEEAAIGHSQLADEADLVVAAPATADLLAKAAAGIADDAPSTILLATKAPVLFAPAMNVNMWQHAATQTNVKTLRERGASFVDPEEGDLACGWYGSGRLAETHAIVEEIERALSDQSYTATEVIVSAGATQEAMDPIRFFSNRSTGRMGYAIARQAAIEGAKVTLISGPTELKVPNRVSVKRVITAEEMRDAMIEAASSAGSPGTNRYVFMVAAVSDHRPEVVSDTKVKYPKSEAYEVKMIPNPDVLAELGDRREELERESGTNLKLVGFAAETGDEEELLSWGKKKLSDKKVNMIVANFAHDGFASQTNRVWLLRANGRDEEVSTADKDLIAQKILARAKKL